MKVLAQNSCPAIGHDFWRNNVSNENAVAKIKQSQSKQNQSKQSQSKRNESKVKAKQSKVKESYVKRVQPAPHRYAAKCGPPSEHLIPLWVKSKQQQNIIGRFAHARSNITRMATALLELTHQQPLSNITRLANGQIQV